MLKPKLTAEQIMQALEDEYRYWSTLDPEDDAGPAIGATGALANVICRAMGYNLQPHKPHERKPNQSEPVVGDIPPGAEDPLVDDSSASTGRS